MIDLKEIQQLSIKKQKEFLEKNKRRKAKFTKKFISKVEKDIKERAKAGALELVVRIQTCYPLDEDEFITYFRKQGFSVATSLYPCTTYWWDEISWRKEEK